MIFNKHNSLLRSALFLLAIFLLFSSAHLSVRQESATNHSEALSPIQASVSINVLPLVGESAVITCEVSAALDAPATMAQLELPDNARLVEGTLLWEDDLAAGETKSFSITAEFTEKGNTAIFCRANHRLDSENSWGDLGQLYLSIGDDNTQVGYAQVPPKLRDRLGVIEDDGDGILVDTGPYFVVPDSSRVIEPVPGNDPDGHAQHDAFDAGLKSNGQLTITGRWRFYDRDDNLVSSRLLVEIVRGDNSGHLAWCWTDIDGYYTCGPFTNPNPVGVRSRFLSYQQFDIDGVPNILVTVDPDKGTVGNTSNAYAYTTSTYTFSDGTHNIANLHINNDSSDERAYWIAYDLTRTWEFIWLQTGFYQTPQETSGSSTVEWASDSTDGTYYTNGENVHLNGADPLSKTVVGHEYGHNIMWNVYNTFPTTNCPDPHYVDLDSHVNCAWTEGWAEFLPMAVNNDPAYYWSDGYSMNLETPTWGSPNWDSGADVEGRVAGALWDMYDGANEQDDQHSEGNIVDIWDTFYHQNDNTFSEFWSAWKSRGHDNTSAGPVMSMYQNTIDFRGGPGNDNFANATTILSLPYTVNNLDTTNATTQGNDPATTCALGNKQSRSVWYKYIPSSTGNYRIHTNGSNYDTVLSVWTGSFGSLTSQGCDDDSGDSSQSTLTLTMYSGNIYYIEVLGYGTSGSGGLMDLSVTSVSPPLPPTNVIATDGDYSDRVMVTWNTNDDADYYNIYRSTSVGGTKTYLGNQTSASFNDYTALIQVVYYYWLKACSNTNGCSDFSSYNSGWLYWEIYVYLPLVSR